MFRALVQPVRRDNDQPAGLCCRPEQFRKTQVIADQRADRKIFQHCVNNFRAAVVKLLFSAVGKGMYLHIIRQHFPGFSENRVVIFPFTAGLAGSPAVSHSNVFLRCQPAHCLPNRVRIRCHFFHVHGKSGKAHLRKKYCICDEYPHLLGIDNADVRDSIELATRFIFRLLEEGNVKLKFRNDVKMKIAYHTPCHMEKLGWAYYSIALLRSIPNVDLTVLNSQCCGIAGTYGFKKENYETSQGIGASLFNQIEEVAADFVATDCETCKWQIEMSTSAKVKHPISVLAEALDLEETRKLNCNK